MFDLPDAKRVRRSDLRAASSSPPPFDAEIEAQLRARLDSIYGNVTLVSAPDLESQVEERDREPDQEVVEEVFEFRLFNTETGEAQKIVLRNGEQDDIGEGGFVKLRDPRQFLVGRAEGEKKTQLAQAVVSGEEVLDAAKKRAWGLEVPWRVKVIKVVGKRKPDALDGTGVGEKCGEAKNGIVEVEVDNGETKKKRPGKKRRILLRGRKKARDEMVAKRKAEKEAKEEAEQEKRTRRNREKKVKRRLKEKAKKTGGSAVGDGGVTAVNTDAKVGADSPAIGED